MMKNPAGSVRSYSDVSGLGVYCLAYGMLGMILTCLGVYLAQLDYFVQWRPFAPSLPGAVEFVEGTGYEVKVRTAEGMVYRWGAGDEIWTQSVANDWATAESCDAYPAAFSPLTHPPENPQDCAVFEESGEIVVTAAYVIDAEGAVWQWDITKGYGFLLYWFLAPIGGIVGIFFGVAVRGVLIRRENQAVTTDDSRDKPAPIIMGEETANRDEPQDVPGEVTIGEGESLARPRSTRKPNWKGLLIVLIVVILVVLIRMKPNPAPNEDERQNESIYTQVAAEVNEHMTAEAAWYNTPPPTPHPAGPAYDFSAQCAAGQWDEWPQTYTCGVQRPGMLSIDVIQYEAPGSETESNAVRVYFPRQKGYVSGKFPVWEIQPGDHFRATLACPLEMQACSLRFIVSFEVFLGALTPLGEWELTSDRRTLEVEVDLSHFSGKLVSFVLETMSVAPEPVEQTALWVDARIENIPPGAENTLP